MDDGWFAGVERRVAIDDTELIGTGPGDGEIGYFERSTHRVLGYNVPCAAGTDYYVPEVNRSCLHGSHTAQETSRTRDGQSRRSKHPTP